MSDEAPYCACYKDYKGHYAECPVVAAFAALRTRAEAAEAEFSDLYDHHDEAQGFIAGLLDIVAPDREAGDTFYPEDVVEMIRGPLEAELAEARGLLDYVPDLVSHGGDCTPCCSQGDPQEVNPCAFANSVRAFLARTAPKEASDE